MESSFKFKRLPNEAFSDATLLIVCGALGKEVIQLIEHNKLANIDVQALPAHYHHRPALIPPAIDEMLAEKSSQYKNIYVVYGDCGTAGGIDKVLEKYNVKRIEGPHCFSFYEGNESFMEGEDDITSFFLTDFFCKHFDKFIWQELGMDKREGMIDLLFGNYKKVVYVAQTQNQELKNKAMEIAERLGLTFEYRYRHYGDLGVFIENLS